MSFDRGYGCLDHFLEGELSTRYPLIYDSGSNGGTTGDTYLHSWEVLAHILEHEDCQDILLDIGMCVLAIPHAFTKLS